VAQAQPGGHLVLEALSHLLPARPFHELPSDHLDRDHALHDRIQALVDDAHGPLAQGRGN
jgi:hypothetical protein